MLDWIINNPLDFCVLWFFGAVLLGYALQPWIDRNRED